jgi:hypothetical protein
LGFTRNKWNKELTPSHSPDSVWVSPAGRFSIVRHDVPVEYLLVFLGAWIARRHLRLTLPLNTRVFREVFDQIWSVFGRFGHYEFVPVSPAGHPAVQTTRRIYRNCRTDAFLSTDPWLWSERAHGFVAVEVHALVAGDSP